MVIAVLINDVQLKSQAKAHGIGDCPLAVRAVYILKASLQLTLTVPFEKNYNILSCAVTSLFIGGGTRVMK